MENEEKEQKVNDLVEVSDIQTVVGTLPSLNVEIPDEPRTPARYRKIFDKTIGDVGLLRTHAALMGAAKLEVMQFDVSIDEEVIQGLVEDAGCILRKVVRGKYVSWAYFWAPDNKARHSALDMAYKLQGYYAPEQIEDVSKSPYQEMSTEELLRRKAEAMKLYKKR